MRSVSAPRHPTKFSPALLPIMSGWLEGLSPILDPMAGVGMLRVPGLIYGELEREWAEQCPGPAVVADANKLPFPNQTFAAVVTSPVYGNRISDHHEARDGSRRTTYRHFLGRPLAAQNTGQMQWGQEYKAAHLRIWAEVRRVLQPYGLFVLNISDHIRKGTIMPVCAWHRDAVEDLGFQLLEVRQVTTNRLRDGDNAELRVDHEKLYLFGKLEG